MSRLKRLVASGMTDGQIALALGRERGAVQRKRVEMKLLPGQSAVYTAMMARINYRRMVRA
jgi:IS30 family transposase